VLLCYWLAPSLEFEPRILPVRFQQEPDSSRGADSALAPPSPQSMRVLVTGRMNPNQLEAHLRPFTDLEEVREVVLVADEPGPALPKLVTEVPHPHLVRAVGRAAAKMFVCVKLAVRSRPHLILSYNLVPHGITSLVTGWAVGVPSAVHLIGGPREWQGGGWRSDNAVVGRLPFPLKPLEAVLVRVIARHDAILVMGSSARRELGARGIRGAKVRALPASVDPARFTDTNEEPTYDIVTVSQLIERKRIGDLLNAVSVLRPRSPNLRCAIAGTGPQERSLRDYASFLGIDDCVDFLGFCRDIEAVYSRSRLFVLTSRSEGLSVALTEAMMSGLPVIVTDVGEASDVVRAGQNGFLFEVGDVESLAGHLSALLEDPELVRTLGQTAKADVVQVSGRARIAELSRAILHDISRS